MFNPVEDYGPLEPGNVDDRPGSRLPVDDFPLDPEELGQFPDYPDEALAGGSEAVEELIGDDRGEFDDLDADDELFE